MFCTNCGNFINKDDKFCPYCGKQQETAFSNNSFFNNKTQSESQTENQDTTSINQTSTDRYNSLYYNGLFYSAISFMLLSFSPIVSLIISCLGLRYSKKNPNYEDKLISKILNTTLVIISIIWVCFSISKLVISINSL